MARRGPCAGCHKLTETASGPGYNGWRKRNLSQLHTGHTVGYEVACVRENRRSQPQLICNECMGILVGHAAMASESETK